MKFLLVLATWICAFQGVTAQTVTIYSDDFRGAEAELAIGQYDYMSMVRMGVSVIRSVKVPDGLQVKLFNQDNFGGNSILITRNISMQDLQAKGFGELSQNTSVIVEKTPEVPDELQGLVVRIYKDDFAGPSIELKPGFYDHSDLGVVGNDQLSSLKISKGLKVTLYEHGASGGRKLVLLTDTKAPFLVKNNFNDVTSSILVEVLLAPTPAPVKKLEEKKELPPAKKEDQNPTPKPDSMKKQPEPELVGVMLYEGAYNGNKGRLEAGYFNTGNLNIENDEVSSVKVGKGYWVLLFEHGNFQGRSLLLTQDASNDFLVGREFDNLTSSVVVGTTDTPAPVATLFQDNFSRPLKVMTRSEYPVLTPDNDISSVEFPRGVRVTLYDGANFEGKSILLKTKTDEVTLQNSGFDNAASSAKIEWVKPRDLTVTLYDGKFNGTAFDLAPGQYRVKDIRLPDNTVSSVRVPQGMQVTLFELDNFKGVNTTILRDTDYTGFKMFDNFYSSFIVEELKEPTLTGVVVTQVDTVQKAPVPDPTPVLEPVQTISAEDLCSLTEGEFQTALAAVKSKNFSDDKMQVATLATKGKCLSNDPVREMAKLFSFEDQALEFVKMMYSKAKERSTYYTLEDIFKFNSTKEEFRKFVSQ